MTVRYIMDCEKPRRAVLTALAEEYEQANLVALKTILSFRFLTLFLPISLLIVAEAGIDSSTSKSLMLLFAGSLLAVLALCVARIERQPGKPVLHHFVEGGCSAWRWVFQLPEPR